MKRITLVSTLFLLIAALLHVHAADQQGSAHGNARKPLPKPGKHGLTVETFADKSMVKNVTAICFDEQGHLYVSESYRFRDKGVDDNRHRRFWVMDDMQLMETADRLALYKKWAAKHPMDSYTKYAERVLQLTDGDSNGQADRATVFAGGFNDPLDGPGIGLLAINGTVYFTCIPHVWMLKDADNDGVAEIRESMQEGFGVRVSISGHDLHGLAVGMDGKLYFSVGDRGYSLTTKEGVSLVRPDEGAVFRCNLDGSDLEVYYYGLRNPQELAFDQYGNLFTGDNNADIGDRARINYILEGGESGWFIGHQILSTFKDDVDAGNLSRFGPIWMAEGIWKTRHPDQAAYILPPIAYLSDGPSGITFNPGKSFPEQYDNTFFLTDYRGSPNKSAIWNFGIEVKGAGFEMVNAHAFHAGIANTDAEFGPDGKLYISDYGGGWDAPGKGNIFTIFDPERIKNENVVSVGTIFKQGFKKQSTAALGKLLTHVDLRVRQRAQFELATRKSEGEAVFKQAIAQKTNPLTRLHGIWGLYQQGNAETLRSLLSDSDAEVRAQAAKMLGELKDTGSSSTLIAALKDKNLRVRSFAAIALGKTGDQAAFAPLVAMVAENNDADAYLRHAGMMGMLKLNKPDDIAALAKHESVAVRRVALLAQRRLQDARIAEYLKDADKSLVADAVRAIYDLPITEATAALCLLADQLDSNLPIIIQARILGANFRSGTPEALNRVLAVAENSAVDMKLRRAAINYLAEWQNPPPVDPIYGKYLALPQRSLDPAKLDETIKRLLKNTDKEMQAAATRWAVELGVGLDAKALAKRINDRSANIGTRRAAMKSFLKKEPAEALKTAIAFASDPDTATARLGFETLVLADQAEATATLSGLAQSLVAGNVKKELQLDVHEAVSRVDAIKGQVAGFDLNQPSVVLNGGDIARGHSIFLNQGICMKCHIVNGKGGATGPNLSKIATLRSAENLLLSINNPNAEIIPGYGISVITLKDGTSLTGSVMKEENGMVFLKTAEKLEQIAKTDIKVQSPAVSPMPPMGLTLPKRDLRDLMAYLQTLK